jgi:site-specific DNA-methyltransferase (adenine-specific)
MQLVIVKNNIGMGYGFRNQYELCLVLEKGKVKYNRNDVSNVLPMQHIQHDENSHPHEKAVGLLKLLIEHSSKEGDLVLDCFAGTGSTLVACQELKRNFIGIELEPRWHKIAEERIKNISNPLF